MIKSSNQRVHFSNNNELNPRKSYLRNHKFSLTSDNNIGDTQARHQLNTGTINARSNSYTDNYNAFILKNQ
jgi:hypothetical protein